MRPQSASSYKNGLLLRVIKWWTFPVFVSGSDNPSGWPSVFIYPLIQWPLILHKLTFLSVVSEGGVPHTSSSFCLSVSSSLFYPCSLFLLSALALMWAGGGAGPGGNHMFDRELPRGCTGQLRSVACPKQICTHTSKHTHSQTCQ